MLRHIRTSNTLLMLNLGCGERTHHSWVNIDYSLKAKLQKLWFLRPFIRSVPLSNYLHHDLRRGIPYDNDTVDVVYSSHVLEHMEKGQAPLFLREIHRVLKPNGIVRIVVPDLELSAREYLDALNALRQSSVADRGLIDRYEWATIMLLDQMVRTRPGGEMVEWLRRHRQSELVMSMTDVLKGIANSDEGHQGYRAIRQIAQMFGMINPARTGELHRWMYDDISLGLLMENAGFSDVKRMSHIESRVPHWETYCLDNNSDSSAYMPKSIWMEAIK